jgi:SAM-dependent methyltransferase
MSVNTQPLTQTRDRSASQATGERQFDEIATVVRESDLYKAEYVRSFVEKWDELIDWDARAESEGRFFIDVLKSRDKKTVLDVATGTGFHSVQLLKAGFQVVSADGSAEMLTRAFDWRCLNRDLHGKFDAIICLGNSFTHLFKEVDRRRALAEFYAALKHDGVLILDQRNYDAILDVGFKTKHKYYYCGDKVSAEPEYVDDSLARFKYTFPDDSIYHLNMFPLRKKYVRRLMADASFQRMKTYGDFQETFDDHEPDFFIHVAEKAYDG